MTNRSLDRRALNRALLARQKLLARAPLSIPSAIETLCGLQAQAPQAPYVALWSRLITFSPDELGAMIEQRRAVRLALFRGTLHLVTARDCRQLRPLLQPVLENLFQVGSPFGKRLAGVDLAAVVGAGRALIEELPRSNAQLRKLLGARWAKRDPEALAYAVQYLLPAVQVPPRGVWGQSGEARFTTAESWLGQPLAPRPSPPKLVRRYLAAFGPATPADIHAWSGSPALRTSMKAMRPRLRRLQASDGRELLDLPDAPLPDPELPAPPRFLPEYDNALLAHAHRDRILGDGAQRASFIGVPTILIDGFVGAFWKLERARGRAWLQIRRTGKLSRRHQTDVEEEGLRLLAFVAPGVEHDVRWARGHADSPAVIRARRD